MILSGFTVCSFLRQSFSLSISFERNYYTFFDRLILSLWHRDPDTANNLKSPQGFRSSHQTLRSHCNDTGISVKKSNLHLNDAISYWPFSKLNVSLEPRERERVPDDYFTMEIHTCVIQTTIGIASADYWRRGSPSIVALWNSFSRLPCFFFFFQHFADGWKKVHLCVWCVLPFCFD